MVKRDSSKKPKQSTKTKSKSGQNGEKKLKTPVAKRQPSAYLIFCAEQRAQRKSEFEQMKPKEIMQYLGAEWRQLSAQQKEVYKTKSSKCTHDNSSDKDDCKMEKCQSSRKSANQQCSTKLNSTDKCESQCKAISKNKENTHEKSASRKATRHHENELNASG